MNQSPAESKRMLRTRFQTTRQWVAPGLIIGRVRLPQGWMIYDWVMYEPCTEHNKKRNHSLTVYIQQALKQNRERKWFFDQLISQMIRWSKQTHPPSHRQIIPHLVNTFLYRLSTPQLGNRSVTRWYLHWVFAYQPETATIILCSAATCDVMLDHIHLTLMASTHWSDWPRSCFDQGGAGYYLFFRFLQEINHLYSDKHLFFDNAAGPKGWLQCYARALQQDSSPDQPWHVYYISHSASFATRHDDYNYSSFLKLWLHSPDSFTVLCINNNEANLQLDISEDVSDVHLLVTIAKLPIPNTIQPNYQPLQPESN